MANTNSSIYHTWRVSLGEAKQIQKRLSEKVVLKDDFEKIEKILGVGVVFSKRQDQVFVGCVSFSFPELEIQKTAFYQEKVDFPYTPGFFAFSAGPAIHTAIRKVERPDLIMFPGRGIAHPRGLGLASHLGILLGLPTIACSKTPLWKNYSEPGAKKGDFVFVDGENEKIIGAVVRTKEDVKPVFVTPGHKISIQTAIRVVLDCSSRYRIPEPLRHAHILAKKMKEGG